jgi:hypothetical protein
MNGFDKVSPEIRPDGRGGPRVGAGRKPGSPNKLSASLKAAILGALEAKGGQAYLERVAEKDPRTFCSLLAKVLPTQIEPSEETSGELVISWIMNDLNGRTKGLPSEQPNRTTETSNSCDG